MVDGVLASAQVFDPPSGAWDDTGTMALQRQSFTATTLADGRVVTIGGGGADDAGARSAEIYDPTSGTWSSTGSMADPRFGHTATLLLNGSVLVVGGYAGGGFEALRSAELYAPIGD
jgi:N-acetylneuraminic acid mutarotase